MVLVKIENYKYSENLGQYFNILPIFEEKKIYLSINLKYIQSRINEKERDVALSKIDKEIEKGSERLKR